MIYPARIDPAGPAWEARQREDGLWSPVIVVDEESHELGSAWFDNEPDCRDFIAGHLQRA